MYCGSWIQGFLIVKRREYIKYIIGASALWAASLAGYSYFIENNMFLISELSLGMGIGKKLVHISDTHLGSSTYSVNSLIKSIENLEPDIIVHTGDHISAIDAAGEAIQIVERLSLIGETYIVWGNHDIWEGFNVEKYRNMIEGSGGATVLVNESVYLGGFWICGVNDPYTFYDDLNKALREVDEEPKILLAHSPQIIDEARGRVDLVLAGHTHGGQVNIPFIGPLWLPLPHRYYKYFQGFFKEEEVMMYVTRGVGRLDCHLDLIALPR